MPTMLRAAGSVPVSCVGALQQWHQVARDGSRGLLLAARRPGPCSSAFDAPADRVCQAPSRSCSGDAASASGVGQQEKIASAFAYCVRSVRQYEAEQYTWAVQLPREMRRPVFALRAFNIESALMADQVHSKESPVVMLRAQWWREALDAMFAGGPPPHHPVALALSAVLNGTRAAAAAGAPAPGGPHTGVDAGAGGAPRQDLASAAPSLSRYQLKRIIDTREADILDGQPPLSVDGIEKYAEGTASQLLYLQLGAAGIVSREADHAASHLGKASGIATLLKGTGFHAAARRCYLPLDLLAEHGVSQEDVYAGRVTEGLRDVALSVASVAKGHLDEARRLLDRVPAAARPLMLSSLAADAYLKALEKVNFDLFDPSLVKGGISPLWHVLQVKWHLLAKTY